MEDDRLRVAVIGAGIAGASASFFLRQIFGGKAEITVFEQSGRIGGRIKSMELAGQTIETGASFFHRSNQYMMKFAKLCGLSLLDYSKVDQRLHIIGSDNRPYFTTIGTPSFLVLPKLIWQYGLDGLRIKRHVTNAINQFSNIYNLQDNGHCYTTPANLLGALSPTFVQMTEYTIDNWLKERVNIHERMRQEIIFAMTSNNYCQNSNIHAFVGSIALAGSDQNLFCVQNGNDQVPTMLIQNVLKENPVDGRKTFSHAKVVEIQNAADTDNYVVRYIDQAQTNNATVEQSEFDYVVLAAPLHQASDLVGPAGVKLPRTEYCEVDHTFFHANLKPDVLDIEPGSYSDSQSLFIGISENYHKEHGGDRIRSLTRFCSFNDGVCKSNNVWTSFSEPQSMRQPEVKIPELFLNLLTPKCFTAQWLAYPVYKPLTDPKTELGSFILAPKLYYPNAIEHVASCMEMGAIAGRNVALLIAEDYQRRASSTKTKSTITVDATSTA